MDVPKMPADDFLAESLRTDPPAKFITYFVPDSLYSQAVSDLSKEVPPPAMSRKYSTNAVPYR
jgi:hypothetical protein